MRPITAADLMNPEVLTVREDLTVSELARFLIANDITGAPVEGMDGGLVGVVSVVDMVRLAADEIDELDAGEERSGGGEGAEDGVAGSRGLVATDGEPGEDDLDGDADDGDGDTGDDGDDGDDGDYDELLVEDIMTPRVFSVSEDATVSEVAKLMLDGHLHRLLVMRDGRPVGIISTSDLLGLLIDEA